MRLPRGHVVRGGRRTAIRAAAAVTICLIFLAVGWWSGHVAVDSPLTGEVQDNSQATAVVVEASVGRSIPVGVTLRQPVSLLATNQLTGVVSSLSGSPDVSTGATLFSVAGVPVRAVVGGTPFYRNLLIGDSGTDVSQVNSALRSLGYLDNASDDVFSSATRRAVQSWQNDLGIPESGEIRLGELVAVPVLPSVLSLGDSIVLGATLAGGEPAVFGRTGAQEFFIVASEEQAALLPLGTGIEIQFQSFSWTALVAGSVMGSDPGVELSLEASGDGAICGADCGRLPPDEEVTLSGAAEVVPEVTGPTVPVSAVRTNVAGSSYVVIPGEGERPVEVLGSSGGLAVISGVRAGELVVVSQGSPARDNPARTSEGP